MTTWSLNETTIKAPSTFSVEHKRIMKETRLASGKMVADVVAVKRVFTLVYPVLYPNEVSSFVDLYHKNEFVEFTFYLDGKWLSATVWVRTLPLAMLRRSPELWDKSTITLEEQ